MVSARGFDRLAIQASPSCCSECGAAEGDPCGAFTHDDGEWWQACGGRAEHALGEFCVCTNGITALAMDVMTAWEHWEIIDHDWLEAWLWETANS
jgi:hypothetical protein